MDKSMDLRRKKNFKEKVNLYHFYYKKKGVYSFLLKNSIKIIIGLAVLVGVVLFVKSLIPDFDESFQALLEKFDTLPVLLLFTVSETLLGLIPPDIFIVWAQKFDVPYLMVFFLGCLSYLGGVLSYGIGNRIGHIPKVDKWVKKKFVEHFDKIRKWGGVLIIFAALFPLPFSPICMVAGMVRFPLPAFFTLALFRFARFFGYAVVLFQLF